jgi:hypothetical protein
MPARDFYHETVKTALIKDQWVITHDPLTLKLGKKDFYVDLGASHLLAAEKVDCKIAIEIKSFTGRSDIDDLEKALGQYVLYQDILAELGKLLLRNRRLKLISFDPKQEVIRQWIVPS